MPVPKRRQTQSRGRKRRTHYKLTPKNNVMECPQCGQSKERHNVCKSCGFYNKREVLDLLQ